MEFNELTFVRNRGELAEGWYDPATFLKAQASAASTSAVADSSAIRRPSTNYTKGDESSDDDGPGPALPNRGISSRKGNKRSGPAVPSLQDLEFQRGTIYEPP